MDKDKIIRAGKIASQIKEWVKPQIKKGTFLLDVAEMIESKIIELGGKPAFPTNLSIDNIAAHYTPSYEDNSVAHGLLKVDFGVNVDGWLSDTAFSLDLDNNEENEKLIKASEKALKNVIKIAKENISVNEIGRIVQETIEEEGFSPVINLSGHEMVQYDLHAGLVIPNTDNGSSEILKKGLYAVEPFATSGSGKVHDGNPSGIYLLINTRNIRNPLAREILKFIQEEYQTLPFCSRWIVKKFGVKSLFSLRQLEESGNLHQFAQLVESYGKVSQAEDTILVEEKVLVTTK